MSYRWFKNGRTVMESYDLERNDHYGITKEYFDDHIGSQKHYGGYLNLKYSKITSLGKLETIDGSLDLIGTNITSLGNLKSVKGDLLLRYINLLDLGKLEYVDGTIYCSQNSSTEVLFENSKFKDQLYVHRIYNKSQTSYEL